MSQEGNRPLSLKNLGKIRIFRASAINYLGKKFFLCTAIEYLRTRNFPYVEKQLRFQERPNFFGLYQNFG